MSSETLPAFEKKSLDDDLHKAKNESLSHSACSYWTAIDVRNSWCIEAWIIFVTKLGEIQQFTNIAANWIKRLN